jgi:hypothetical protein
MKLLEVKKSTQKNKKYMAVFDDGSSTHFGLKGSSTYLDHNDDKKKDAYIARHKVNENWDDPKSAGSLARYILWNKKTLKESIADYKKRFNL